jgi:hypothetical protein
VKRTGNNPFSTFQALAIFAAAIPTVAGLTIGRRRRPSQASRPEWRRILSRSRLQPVAATGRGKGARKRRPGELAENVQTLKHGSAKLVGDLGGAVRTDFGPLARDATVRAADVAEKLSTRGKILASDLGERWQSNVSPVAKTWAQEALEEAEDVVKAARERGKGIASAAREEYVPRLSTKTSQLGHIITATSAGAAQMLDNRISERLNRRRLPAPKRVRRQVASTVSGTLHQVGNQTKHVAIETSLIGAWTAALGMVIYYGLLTPEQRERLMTSLTNAYEQAREVVRDLQGETHEF